MGCSEQGAVCQPLEHVAHNDDELGLAHGRIDPISVAAARAPRHQLKAVSILVHQSEALEVSVSANPDAVRGGCGVAWVVQQPNGTKVALALVEHVS